jgi:arginyl-tRNA synthetase
MKSELELYVAQIASKLGLPSDSFVIEYPESPDHGDFSTNIAMANAKAQKTNPRALAEKIVAELNRALPAFIESVSIAGPGFINFKVKDSVIAEKIVGVNDTKQAGSANDRAQKTVMVEYTDPNPFKIFHIGHLMSNAIGESIARLIEHSGAKVIRACYQGDVGLHVAKTLSAIIAREGIDNGREAFPKGSDSVVEKVDYLGRMYVIGSTTYENDPEAKKAIDALNKKIFDKSDPKVNEIYEKGRRWSLEYFDLIYKRLGTEFVNFFFESEVAEDGIAIVKKNAKKGLLGLFKKPAFTESDGAIVFKGEEHGLHTRVFITSQGLPTYEAKELGLNTRKFKLYPDLDQSVIITANEQSDYFKVILKVFSLIAPSIYDRTKHMSHGIMRFAEGKMSSRKGNIIPAETLIDDIKKLVMERIADRGFTPAEADEVSDAIAIAAIKYTILRQSVGSDVIFDSAKSISFEGDSGPYLQYSVVRANSIMEKAKKEGMNIDLSKAADVKMPETVGPLEKLIVRFPDIAARAASELAPQLVANYLINLAGVFNSFYAGNTIVDANEALSPYRIALTGKFIQVMTEGLTILGIRIPKRM